MSSEQSKLSRTIFNAKEKRVIEPFQKMLTRANGDIDEAITDALNAACNEVHAEAGTFWFYSRFGDGMIHPRAHFGGKIENSCCLSPGEGIAGWVIETGEPVFSPDCSKDSRWAGKIDQETGFVTRSMICVALRGIDRPFGCLQLINKQDGSLFNEKDAALVAGLAKEISENFVSLHLMSEGSLENDVTVMLVSAGDLIRETGGLEPVQTADYVNRYLSFVAESAEGHSGSLNKYFGGTVLIYWLGAEGPRRAVEMAKELMERLPDVNKALERDFGIPVTLKTGIGFGQAFVGNTGASALSDHTVFGKPAAEAVRLLKDTPAGSIGVSEAVRDNLKEQGCRDITLRPVDWIERVLRGQKYRSYRVAVPTA